MVKTEEPFHHEQGTRQGRDLADSERVCEDEFAARATNDM